MQLTERQARIMDIVQSAGPITSEQIAHLLKVSRSALRPDLAILTMVGLLEARPRVGYYVSRKKTPASLSETLRSYRVGDIKSVPVVVQTAASIYEAAVTLFLEDVGTLYVVTDAGFLEGVVSRKDLLRASLGQPDIHQMPVSVVMTRMPNVITATPEETVWEAARKIVEHEVDSLPVVKAEEDSRLGRLQVIGRVSKTNVTRLFVELGEGGI
ncbi:MAG: transcriptional regulator [Clostridia bacterium]|nr:MAG: transcriptional regulator [Clostridia bacterium]